MSRWQQPRGLVVTGAKFRVRAEIVLDADGGVVSARIVASSGNAEMDQSVRDAVRQVSRVSSLPPGLADPTYAVILNFDL
jgi:TonB family protein